MGEEMMSGSDPMSMPPVPAAEFVEEEMSGSGSGSPDDPISDKKDKEEKKKERKEKKAKKAEKNKEDEEEYISGSVPEEVEPSGTEPAGIFEELPAEVAAKVTGELKPDTAAGIVEGM